MAVYTHVSAEEMAQMLSRFPVGKLLSAKGIAEGVENSNYMIDAEKGRYFLTIYEKRVDRGDLPFFLSLLDHLAAKGCPVPATIHNEAGETFSLWNDKAFALIAFLPGVSVSRPTPAQAHAVGVALADLHLAVADFKMSRANSLGPEGWFDLAANCGAALDEIQSGLQLRVEQEVNHIRAHWPTDLPQSVIHADLFPDNVLMRDDAVSGLIDFYFACTDIRAYDVAVTLISWSFSSDGATFNAEVFDSLLAGYESHLPLQSAERAALPTLLRGACLRFLLTRSWDWLNTPADALVKRHDPLAMLRRLDHFTQS